MKGKRVQPDDMQWGAMLGDVPFVVAAAHELKAPLALVRQLSLYLESGSASPEEQLRLLRQVTLTSERALRLTTNLSKVQRLEDSLFTLEPVNPQQLCEEVVHELAPLYAAKGREIRVKPRRRQSLVVANRDLLRRIILNFGDNALHYAESDVPVELETTYSSREGRVRIGVRDYGPALATDAWQRLESQLGAATYVLHDRPQASGLGLYVSQQFAQAMQGAIGVTRHRDGVTFYVDMAASTQLRLL